ncbi:MAG TPA: glutamate synthase [Deltaproteobacteria bacterium]|nr:glutamate synthase [Deltaproteobacteria bacterium]OQC25211.1 MAG: Glutamine amidotransferases class-II [Deltaproteobacteria bacterium ADurb.Bin072]HNQ84340.1 glutamate synthase [Deltaproteobacteria bacterium]HNS88565.1 glutamate synthase [Deltaproteobacteria bacterium]HOA44204.1 glutamate synthase [Deltaproteobacteria bacterium]
MCRLFAITSEDALSPMVAIRALDVMKEGHDGSGVGLLMTDLGGDLEQFRGSPIMSGIFSQEGIKKLDRYMMELGLLTKFKLSIRPSSAPPEGTPRRDVYLIRVYEYPYEWEGLSEVEIASRLMHIRVDLRKLGEEDQSMMVFSFWPDTIMIKEVGDPVAVAEYLGLDRQELKARVLLAQGRQNTNYAITLYACHPFFIQGYATMTNGENTAFIPNKEYLMSRGYSGYMGYQSDSEVFTHILHYTRNILGLGLEEYKHVITPLKDEELMRHPEASFLRNLKHSCRFLTTDGPNCVIGCLPDRTLFMVQDSKKLRPGVVGGRPGMFAFSSEMCGLDKAIPDRDRKLEYQPMKYDVAYVDAARAEIRKWNQWEPCTLPH